MATTLSTRIRTDVIGSLLRPPAVLEAHTAFRAGRLPEAELRAIEDAAILEALRRQEELGLDVITDGEMRRDAWMTEFSDAVDGFAAEYPVVRETRPDGSVELVERHTKVVVGRLRQRRRLTAYEVPFLKEHLGDRGYKVTMPSPNVFAWGSYQDDVTGQAYASREALHLDAVEIIQREMLALVEDGVPYLQLDEGFNRHVTAAWRQSQEAQGLDPEQLLANDIAMETRCYDALPRDRVALGSHLCRGNRVSWSGGRGSYDAVAEQLFNELHVDRFLLEYDTDRAGGFEPLRFLPKDKTVVLGLVTSKSPELESKDDLKRRIDEAAKFCSLDQLALSPQCGFFHGFDDDTMTAEQQWHKLRLVVETAREVWGS